MRKAGTDDGRFVVVRGIRYYITDKGSGPPVILLHGFSESSRTWCHIAPDLTAEYRTVCPDLLGHGQSDKPADIHRYALTEAARDVLCLADALGLDRFHLIGYSMGGRVAQHVALLQHERLLSLMLLSSSPGIASPQQRHTRRLADNRLADTIQKAGIAAFVDFWENLALFAPEKKLPAATQLAIREERLANDPAGLANSLRGAGAGTQQYLLPELMRLSVRTLLITGALDVKYTELAHRMAAGRPNVTVTVLPDTGHAVHRENPVATGRYIGQFLHGRTICT